MGELASGGNAAAMETLRGKISNLSDAWHQFEDALLQDKSEGIMKSILDNMTFIINDFTANLNRGTGSFGEIEKINDKIIAQKEIIRRLNDGQGMIPESERPEKIAAANSELQNLIASRVQEIAKYHDVITAENARTNETKKFNETVKEEAELGKQATKIFETLSETNYKLTHSQAEYNRHMLEAKGFKGEDLEKALKLANANDALSASSKGVASETKAAAREQAALTKTFEDTVTSLSLHNIELSKTPRQLEEATLASKGLNKAQLEQAMALWDVGKALEAKKQLNEEEKSQLDSLIDRYNKATMSARDYYSSTLTTTSPDGIKSPMSGADKAPLLDQFDKTSGAEAQKKAQEDAKTALDAYNTSLDDTKTKTQDLGGITTAIFDGALGGISLMTGALTTMTDSLAENSKAMAELNKNQLLNNSIADPKERAANFKKYAKEEATLNAKNVQDQMTGTRQLAGAASKLFADKSAGAKAFHAIEVGIAVAQLAMRAKDMAMSAIATVKNIAEGASKFFAQSGWWGFAGVAAMLALMAGLGAMASGGGGGGGGPAPSNADLGTGSVLGDPNAQSKSIENSNDLLKSIHAEEYIELRGINKGVQALNGSILSAITKQFQLGAIQGVNAPNLGKSGHTMVAGGLATNAISLADLLAGADVQGAMYTTDAVRGGSKNKPTYSYVDYFSEMPKELGISMTKVFKSIGTVMSATAEVIGKDIGFDFSEKINKAIIPQLKIDTMGLSGEDAVKKANAVISSMLDRLSNEVFGEMLGKYQQLGEGMLETTIRIVAEIAIVKDALHQSGLSITTDVIAVSDALVQAAGGLEQFQAQFESFFDKFYSDAEKQTRLQKTLVGSLAEANVILPTTRENYKKLVEGLNMTNPLDQQRYSLLLELSEAADKYYSMLESIAKTQRSLDIQYMELTGNAVGALTEKRKDELAAMDASLRITQQGVYILADANKAVADATAVANKAVTDAMALASKAVSAAVNEVSKAISNLSSLAQKLRAAATGTTVTTDATTRKDRADAQAVLNAALKVANAGGSIDNFAGMDKALTDISKPSEQLYSSFTDYARDQALTSGTITQLADYADAQVSMAQQQIDAINGVSKEVIRVNNAIVTLTGSADGTKSAVIDVDGQLVTLTRSQAISADGTTQEVTKVNGKIVDLIGSANGTKSAVIDVNGKMITLTSSQITSALGITDSVANLTEAQKNLATVQDQKTQIEKMLGNNLAVISVSEAINRLAGSLNAQNAATKAIALATAADKAATKADLALIQANTKATASALALSNAKAASVANKSTTQAQADKDADALAKAQKGLGELTQARDYSASVGAWDHYFAYQGYIDSSNKKIAVLTINAANSATAAAVAAQDALTGASYSGLSSTAAKDASAARAASAAYQTARAYADATAAALPAFAAGGQHEGGWRIVGENGPELEKTGASRIFSNPQSKSLLNMDELLAEIRQLRSDVRAGQADVRAGQEAIANNTLRTAKILRDVTQDGTAITTVVAA
jgi:hypothetical protein